MWGLIIVNWTHIYKYCALTKIVSIKDAASQLPIATYNSGVTSLGISCSELPPVREGHSHKKVSQACLAGIAREAQLLFVQRSYRRVTPYRDPTLPLDFR